MSTTKKSTKKTTRNSKKTFEELLYSELESAGLVKSLRGQKGASYKKPSTAKKNKDVVFKVNKNNNKQFVVKRAKGSDSRLYVEDMLEQMRDKGYSEDMLSVLEDGKKYSIENDILRKAVENASTKFKEQNAPKKTKVVKSVESVESKDEASFYDFVLKAINKIGDELNNVRTNLTNKYNKWKEERQNKKEEEKQRKEQEAKDFEKKLLEKGITSINGKYYYDGTTDLVSEEDLNRIVNGEKSPVSEYIPTDTERKISDRIKNEQKEMNDDYKNNFVKVLEEKGIIRVNDNKNDERVMNLNGATGKKTMRKFKPQEFIFGGKSYIINSDTLQNESLGDEQTKYLKSLLSDDEIFEIGSDLDSKLKPEFKEVNAVFKEARNSSTKIVEERIASIKREENEAAIKREDEKFAEEQAKSKEKSKIAKGFEKAVNVASDVLSGIKDYTSSKFKKLKEDLRYRRRIYNDTKKLRQENPYNLTSDMFNSLISAKPEDVSNIYYLKPDERDFYLNLTKEDIHEQAKVFAELDVLKEFSLKSKDNADLRKSFAKRDFLKFLENSGYLTRIDDKTKTDFSVDVEVKGKQKTYGYTVSKKYAEDKSKIVEVFGKVLNNLPDLEDGNFRVDFIDQLLDEENANLNKTVKDAYEYVVEQNVANGKKRYFESEWKKTHTEKFPSESYDKFVSDDPKTKKDENFAEFEEIEATYKSAVEKRAKIIERGLNYKVSEIENAAIMKGGRIRNGILRFQIRNSIVDQLAVYYDSEENTRKDYYSANNKKDVKDKSYDELVSSIISIETDSDYVKKVGKRRIFKSKECLNIIKNNPELIEDLTTKCLEIRSIEFKAKNGKATSEEIQKMNENKALVKMQLQNYILEQEVHRVARIASDEKYERITNAVKNKDDNTSKIADEVDAEKKSMLEEYVDEIDSKLLFIVEASKKIIEKNAGKDMELVEVQYKEKDEVKTILIPKKFESDFKSVSGVKSLVDEQIQEIVKVEEEKNQIINTVKEEKRKDLNKRYNEEFVTALEESGLIRNIVGKGSKPKKYANVGKTEVDYKYNNTHQYVVNDKKLNDEEVEYLRSIVKDGEVFDFSTDLESKLSKDPKFEKVNNALLNAKGRADKKVEESVKYYVDNGLYTPKKDEKAATSAEVENDKVVEDKVEDKSAKVDENVNSKLKKFKTKFESAVAKVKEKFTRKEKKNTEPEYNFVLSEEYILGKLNIEKGEDGKYFDKDSKKEIDKQSVNNSMIDFEEKALQQAGITKIGEQFVDSSFYAVSKGDVENILKTSIENKEKEETVVNAEIKPEEKVEEKNPEPSKDEKEKVNAVKVEDLHKFIYGDDVTPDKDVVNALEVSGLRFDESGKLITTDKDGKVTEVSKEEAKEIINATKKDIAIVNAIYGDESEPSADSDKATEESVDIDKLKTIANALKDLGVEMSEDGKLFVADGEGKKEISKEDAKKLLDGKLSEKDKAAEKSASEHTEATETAEGKGTTVTPEAGTGVTETEDREAVVRESATRTRIYEESDSELMKFKKEMGNDIKAYVALQTIQLAIDLAKKEIHKDENAERIGEVASEQYNEVYNEYISSPYASAVEEDVVFIEPETFDKMADEQKLTYLNTIRKSTENRINRILDRQCKFIGREGVVRPGFARDQAEKFFECAKDELIDSVKDSENPEKTKYTIDLANRIVNDVAPAVVSHIYGPDVDYQSIIDEVLNKKIAGEYSLDYIKYTLSKIPPYNPRTIAPEYPEVKTRESVNSVRETSDPERVHAVVEDPERVHAVIEESDKSKKDDKLEEKTEKKEETKAKKPVTVEEFVSRIKEKESKEVIRNIAESEEIKKIDEASKKGSVIQYVGKISEVAESWDKLDDEQKKGWSEHIQNLLKDPEKEDDKLAMAIVNDAIFDLAGKSEEEIKKGIEELAKKVGEKVVNKEEDKAKKEAKDSSVLPPR